MNENITGTSDYVIDFADSNLLILAWLYDEFLYEIDRVIETLVRLTRLGGIIFQRIRMLQNMRIVLKC